MDPPGVEFRYSSQATSPQHTRFSWQFRTPSSTPRSLSFGDLLLLLLLSFEFSVFSRLLRAPLRCARRALWIGITFGLGPTRNR